jgi:hypothetical protein
LKKFLAWADHDRGSVIILAVVVGLFFLPALISGKFIWPNSGFNSDASHSAWPAMIGYANSLRAGRIDLWDSSMALGRPLPGDPGVLFVYPFNLVFLLVPPALAFTILDVVHVLLSSLFTFWWLRLGEGIVRPAALLAGLIFAFAPKTIAHLAGGHLGLVWSLAWVPAVLLGLKLAFDRRRLIFAALAGLALAVQLPMMIQISYYTAALGSGYWLWHLGQDVWKRNWKHAGGLAGIFALWLITFALLAAVTLLPFLELFPYNSRQYFTLADAGLYALPWTLLFTLFAPSSFQFPEWIIFPGVLSLGLILLGWRGIQSRTRWLFALLAVVALLYSLGEATPLFALAFNFIPGFRLLRVPTRAWFFGNMALAVLAGLAVQALADEGLREHWRRQRSWLIRLTALYGVALSAGMIGSALLFRQWAWWLTLQLLTFGLFAALVARWLSGRLEGQSLQWLLLPLVLLDLLPLDANYIQLVDPREKFLRSTPALDFVSAQPGLFRVYTPTGELPYAVAAERRVESLEGLLSLQIAHTVNLIHQAAGCENVRYATAVPACLYDQPPGAIPSAQKLGVLNVRFVVSKVSLTDPNFVLVKGGYPAVYENSSWQPRARVLPKGTAEIITRRPGEYDLTVNATEAAELIVSETWLPGWQATVDGERQSVERVEGALLGVALKPGRHAVHLFYLPFGWRLGWPISLSSVGVLFVWSMLEWRRKRR